MSVISVEEVIEYLKLEADEDQAFVQGFIDSAERDIALVVGPLAPQAVTQVVYPVDPSTLILTTAQATAITSITSAGGTVVNPALFKLDGETGLATAWDSAPLSEACYTVVYQAGYVTLPDNVRTAVLELIRDDWEASQTGAGAPSPRQSPPGMVDDLPSTVRRHLNLEPQLPGMA